MFGVKLLIFLACLSWSQCKLDQYCSLCKDHTLCRFQGIGKDCKGGGDSGVTSKDIIEIVEVHNWLRGIVASGAESRGAGGPQPQAANLMKLKWDHELAKVAQRWADQCHFYHDTCRDDPRWKVGQNIYWAWKYPKHEANWTEAILSWYDEVSLFNPDNVEAYRFESSTGHYTQILWHDTTSIGCGRRDYGPNKIYVCNYGPAGNWINEPMYKVGEACSKCPKGSYCNSYLCETRKPINESAKFDSKFLRTLPEVPEIPQVPEEFKENLDILQPPLENAKDVFTSETNKKIICTESYDQIETQQNNEQQDNQQEQNNQNQDSQQEQNNQNQNNQQKQENKLLRSFSVNDDVKEDTKATTNSIDGTRTEVELDPELKLKMENIQQQIEDLVKKAVEKSNKKP